MTLFSPKTAPYLLLSVLSVAFCIWFSRVLKLQLWADEIVTIEFVTSSSFKHFFSAVWLGLDATPPLYTGYGWFMHNYVIPWIAPELLLRITNAVFVGATIWILYLLIRHFFDRITALATISTFVLLERHPLAFLTLEIRTYAVYVFAAVLAIYFSLRAIERPSRARWVYTAVSYCVLMSSHAFGIVYVVCVAACSITVAVGQGNAKLARNSCLVALPALIMFTAWLPVVRRLAQLGSWIPSPWQTLLTDAIYIPNHAAILALLILLLAVRLDPRFKAPMLAPWRSLADTQKFILLIAFPFLVSTLAVWLFSKAVFPVFVPRYFFPNILLHVVWLTLLIHFVFTYLRQSMLKYALTAALALLTAVSIIARPPYSEDRVPCFDSARNEYLEDSFRDTGPLVAISVGPWLTRLNRPRQAIFLVDDALYQVYAFDVNWVLAFATWADQSQAVTTTEKLLNTNKDFMIIVDRDRPWFKFIQVSHKLELTELAKSKDCTLGRVRISR
jgi:uncharacterized membrane protein